jgi:hypothetical protein
MEELRLKRVMKTSLDIVRYLKDRQIPIMEGSLASQAASVEIFSLGLVPALDMQEYDEVRKIHELFNQHWRKAHEALMVLVKKHYGEQVVKQVASPSYLVMGLPPMLDTGIEITITIRDNRNKAYAKISLSPDGIQILEGENTEHIEKLLYLGE